MWSINNIILRLKNFLSQISPTKLPSFIGILLLSAVYIVLYSAKQSIGLWSFSDLIISILKLGFLGIVAFIGLSLLTKKTQFSLLAISSSLLFYFLGAIFSAIFYQKIASILGKNIMLLDEAAATYLPFISLFLFLLFLLFLYWISSKKEKWLAYCISFFLWFGAAQCLYLAYITAFSKEQNAKPKIDNTAFYPEKFPPTDSLPDIYFLLFDEMMSPNALYQNYQLEEALQWKDSLAKRNCYLADSAYTYFTETIESIQSIMTMDTAKSAYQLYKMRENIQYAPVYKILQKAGYTLYNYSIFPMLEQEVVAQQIDYFGRVKNLEEVIYAKTWNQQYENNLKENQRDSSHLYIKNQLLAITKDKINKQQAKFIYAHFMLPHAPFGCKKDGSFYTQTEIASKNLTDLYLEQSLFAFEFGKNMVDDILAHTQRPTVIIFTGDHGFRVNYYGLQSNHPEQANQPFHAIYTSDSLAEPKHFCLTQTFPFLFNHYLRTHFPK